MVELIEADERGALVLPPGVVPPGTRFSIEPMGDDVVLRREAVANHCSWPEREERIARFRAFLATLPAGGPIPLEATRREAIYSDEDDLGIA